MTEQIKSAIDRIIDTRDYKYSHFSFVDDTGKAFDLAIRSLQAWEEVLTELEKENSFWTRQAFKHKDDEFAEGKAFGLSKAIDIIKQKLEGVTENE